MNRFQVGVADPALAGRPSVHALTQINYLAAAVGRVDSFWVPDHINSVWPRSLWRPEYCGGAALFPRIDGHTEPWTTLGYIAARNWLARLRLGVCVTDAGRRKPEDERFSVSGRVSANAMSRTEWNGLSQSRDSRRRWRRSAHCGIRPADWSTVIRPTFRCAMPCSTCRHI